MKTYDVTITETLQMTVPIEAESLTSLNRPAEEREATTSIPGF